MVFTRLRRFLRRVFNRRSRPQAPAQASMPAETAQELVLRAGRAATGRRGELVPLGMEGEDGDGDGDPVQEEEENATARSEEAGEAGGEPHLEDDDADNVTVIDEEEQEGVEDDEEGRGLR